MTNETIATSTSEVAGSYDGSQVTDAQLVSDSINQPDVPSNIVDDMPWLLRDKFKGESLDDVIKQQAMAYPELQSKMGAWWGAPKEGDYDTSTLSEHGISADDPIFANMKSTFKEMGLSNAAVKKLAASYDESLKAMVHHEETRLQSEMTPELAQKAQRVEGWMQKFGKAEQDTIKGWLQTKQDFDMMNILIAMNPNVTSPANNVPTQGGNHGYRYESASEVEREKINNLKRYQSDQEYRNQVAQRYRDAKSRER